MLKSVRVGRYSGRYICADMCIVKWFCVYICSGVSHWGLEVERRRAATVGGGVGGDARLGHLAMATGRAKDTFLLVLVCFGFATTEE